MQGDTRGLSLPMLVAPSHLLDRWQNFYAEKILDGTLLSLRGMPMPICLALQPQYLWKWPWKESKIEAKLYSTSNNLLAIDKKHESNPKNGPKENILRVTSSGLFNYIMAKNDIQRSRKGTGRDLFGSFLHSHPLPISKSTLLSKQCPSRSIRACCVHTNCWLQTQKIHWNE